MKTTRPMIGLLSLAVAVGISGSCAAAVPENLGGTIKIDGSSTVYPITEAVAEEFGNANHGVKVTVGISGTGGGFKKFIAGETDISDASRPIKPAEAEQAKAAGINYIEVPIAYDALTVVVNPKNTWVTSLTVADLKKIWEPEAQGKIMTWNQVRPEWPNKPIKLFGPGTDSGTFDYFTETINGKEDACRGDYTASEDDNVLVQGVASEEGGLGFFGLAYYEENKSKLKAVAIDSGKGAVMPGMTTVVDGTYQPLARPLFLYIKKDAAERPEVAQFVNFYLGHAPELTKQVGYIPLQKKVYQLASQRFEKRSIGTIFQGSPVGVTLEKVLSESKPS